MYAKLPTDPNTCTNKLILPAICHLLNLSFTACIQSLLHYDNVYKMSSSPKYIPENNIPINIFNVSVVCNYACVRSCYLHSHTIHYIVIISNIIYVIIIIIIILIIIIVLSSSFSI